MALDETTLWQLRLVREFLALAEREVSLACFWWSKPPGNRYVTFYPTAWLSPSAHGARGLDAGSLGAAVFHRSTNGWRGARATTLGDYGVRTLEIPGWASAGADRDPYVCSAHEHPDPHGAARRVLRALDIEGLARVGDVDAGTSAQVQRWLDAMIALGEQPGIESFDMQFEQTGSLRDLRTVRLYDGFTRTTFEVGWPEHAGETNAG